MRGAGGPREMWGTCASFSPTEEACASFSPTEESLDADHLCVSFLGRTAMRALPIAMFRHAPLARIPRAGLLVSLLRGWRHGHLSVNQWEDCHAVTLFPPSFVSLLLADCIT